MKNTTDSETRDHGGRLDAAIARYGGRREDWLDLSTGINPVPWPCPEIAARHWTDLPDQRDVDALAAAARRFWRVPKGAGVLAAPGASSLIARIPALASPGRVHIPGPTYNEHAAAFEGHGWSVMSAHAGSGDACVLVNPNNPDGRIWSQGDATAPLSIVDESFADVEPAASLIDIAERPGTLILKSFGKFWGLAGIRLGFAIGDPELLSRLADLMGPWPVSGPALAIGRAALEDQDWAETERKRLRRDAERLDRVLVKAGATTLGGTSLFRLYQVDHAFDWADKLAQHRILVRTFPYDPRWLRLGLPAPDRWSQVEDAI